MSYYCNHTAIISIKNFCLVFWYILRDFLFRKSDSFTGDLNESFSGNRTDLKIVKCVCTFIYPMYICIHIHTHKGRI